MVLDPKQGDFERFCTKACKEDFCDPIKEAVSTQVNLYLSVSEDKRRERV